MIAYAPTLEAFGTNIKKLRGRHLIHQYYTISGTVHVKVEENGSPTHKSITHMVDLERLFPWVEIESL